MTVPPTLVPACSFTLHGSWMEGVEVLGTQVVAGEPELRQAAYLSASHGLLGRVGRHIEAFAAYNSINQTIN